MMYPQQVKTQTVHDFLIHLRVVVVVTVHCVVLEFLASLVLPHAFLVELRYIDESTAISMIVRTPSTL
jgi:hypothetical protein